MTEPAQDVTQITLHAGAHTDWHVPWASYTVARGTSARLVRDGKTWRVEEVKP